MSGRILLCFSPRGCSSFYDKQLQKAHVDGYTRSDGTPVKGYDTKHLKAADGPPSTLHLPGQPTPVMGSHPAPAPKPAPKVISAFQQKFGGGGFKAPQYGMGGGKQGGLFGGGQGAPLGSPKAYHPKPNDKGGKVGLYHPHTASAPESWADPAATATVPAGGSAPAELHGVPFEPWADAPKSLDEWLDVPGQDDALEEPEFHCPPGNEAAAGVVIEEPDGRVWLVSPSNAFGGYKNTFPKGRADDGLPLQATAIKEAFEESGLQVEITGFVGDFARTNTFTRYYRARRVGGTPADMGWESQAVRLAPHAGLEGLLNGAADKPIREALTGA